MISVLKSSCCLKALFTSSLKSKNLKTETVNEIQSFLFLSFYKVRRFIVRGKKILILDNFFITITERTDTEDWTLGWYTAFVNSVSIGGHLGRHIINIHLYMNWYNYTIPIPWHLVFQISLLQPLL